MEQAQQEKVYMERLPLVAMQIRSALGNIYYGMQKLAPADERDEDPILDANAAMLYHGYFRLLRLAKNLESASMLNRKELLPTENTDLKVWLDEIIREAEVPFELKGVQLEMVSLERSRLKIPMMDFASITYLPDTKSKSLSYFVIVLTNDLTLSIEFNEICTVFILKTSLNNYCHIDSNSFLRKSQLNRSKKIK